VDWKYCGTTISRKLCLDTQGNLSHGNHMTRVIKNRKANVALADSLCCHRRLWLTPAEVREYSAEDCGSNQWMCRVSIETEVEGGGSE
jgi:hypothetical protein